MQTKLFILVTCDVKWTKEVIFQGQYDLYRETEPWPTQIVCSLCKMWPNCGRVLHSISSRWTTLSSEKWPVTGLRPIPNLARRSRSGLKVVRAFTNPKMLKSQIPFMVGRGGGGETGNQLSNFDAKSKNAKIPNPLYRRGAGGTNF